MELSRTNNNIGLGMFNLNIIKSINEFIDVGALAFYLAFYLVYSYFMNKTSEKKEFQILECL